MTPTLKQLDELEKKAAQTEEYLNSLGRSDGDYHTKAHDDAADDAWIARRNFERALIDFWRSEEGRQMRENDAKWRKYLAGKAADERDQRERERDIAAEAAWKERQGGEYGSY
jgi:hypothetical protein